MIFTKHPCLFFELNLYSKMDRKLIIAEPIQGIDGKNLAVATAHFESREEYKIRKAQMEATFSALNGIETLLVGDFNFDNSKTSETSVYTKAGYED
jgi:endonuclease/exonuclease/phosphatase family metal-dependent hydrolase